MGSKFSGKDEPKVTEERLLEYIRGLHPEREGLTISQLEDITTGWEAEIHCFVVEHEGDGGRVREERVIRLYIGDPDGRKAREEYKVLNTLSSIGFPVPRVFHLETNSSILGGPFIVMEWVKGRILSDAYYTSTEEEAASLMGEFARIFVHLHRLDGRVLFSDEFPEGGTQDFLERLFAMAEEVMTESGVNWFQPVIDWLKERRSDVEPIGLSLLHQDYHTRNVLQREDGSLVVLDWTQAMPGDYRADLAWSMLLMSTYDRPSFRETILEAYEEAAGTKVKDIEYFEILAAVKRLLTVSYSFAVGSEGLGLRPEALEMMKESKGHLTEVYRRLMEGTRIRLPEFEAILEGL
jgi:aminoglycoside phosphotransferase (APT) family kinase protein